MTCHRFRSAYRSVIETKQHDTDSRLVDGLIKRNSALVSYVIELWIYQVDWKIPEELRAE